MNSSRIVGQRLSFDWKLVLAIVVGTLLLIVDAYHRLTPIKGLDRLILYLLVPLLIVILVFRENPATYGFVIGDWRIGLLLTAGSILLMAPVLWLVARSGTMRAYYELQLNGLPWS